MMIEFYAVESLERSLVANTAAMKQNLSFVGEAVLKWKHCFEENNVNNHVMQHIYMSDAENRIKDSNQILSAQVFVTVKYCPAGAEGSRYNADGTKKPQKAQYD